VFENACNIHSVPEHHAMIMKNCRKNICLKGYHKTENKTHKAQPAISTKQNNIFPSHPPTDIHCFQYIV
jgi:hypothetical protein